MSQKKPTPGGRAKKKTEVSLVRSSAAEYLSFVAAGGDSETSVEMRYEDENIWLTQKMMAALYDVSIPAINQHLKRIFSDNELEEGAVVKQYLIAAADGKSYQTKHYNLQAIIAVGFKIENARAVQFRKWAIREQITTFQALLAATGMRRGINLDLAAATEKMKFDLSKMLEGELPEDAWRLELTLTHRMSDGSSSGSRNYELTLDEGGFSAWCYGSEWQQGEGSDTWTGDTFSYQPNGSKRESGNLYEFVGEFKIAIRDPDYGLTVEFNGDSLSRLPEPEPSDTKDESLVSRVLRKLVVELQAILGTPGGKKLGLVTVWDEICVQQQTSNSPWWADHELTTRGLIAGTVAEMPGEGRARLWRMTDQGKSWTDSKESADESPCPCDEDIGEHLYGRLMSVAADYLNHRVIGYLNRPDYGGDDASEVVAVSHKWDLTPGIELTVIGGLVARLSRLAGLSHAIAEELAELRVVLVEMRHGVIPENMWELELSETIGDERSRGTRTFQIFADKDGVRINRDDTAWQEGVGADSVSGPSFYITHNSEEHCADDLCALIQEFESAAAEGIDALMLRIDGSPIC